MFKLFKRKTKSQNTFVTFKLHEKSELRDFGNSKTLYFPDTQNSVNLVSIRRDMKQYIENILLHEIVETEILHTINKNFPKSSEKKFIPNVTHFLTSLSLNQYSVIFPNEVITKYQTSDRLAKI